MENYKKFIISMFLIIIPLILLILCYRRYAHNYCQNDMKCLKEKLIFNLDNLNYKLKIESFNINQKIKKAEKKEETKEMEKKRKEMEEKTKEMEEKDEVIEGFFGGLGNWFSGSAPATLPVSPGSLPNESLNTLEKKINDKMIPSTTFPPGELNGNTDDFKDADNTEILNSINPKLTENKEKIAVKPNTETSDKEAIFSKKNLEKSPESKPIAKLQIKEKIKEQIVPQQDIKSLLGSCQFFNDKCPEKYLPLGNFSILGVESNSILSCGNVQNTKPGKAVAQIKNNSIYEIHITDQGHGFNPESPPKVSIEGGKGHGATAEAIVDDDGFLKLIKIINPGYNYSETPNVIIDAPFMNTSCHLCCKGNSIE